MESSSLASTSSHLVFLQIFSKLATFIPNQLIVRIAPPEVYGTASIQFELLLSTILFLSREGVRNASLRTGSSDRSPAIKNVALLPFLAGAPITIMFSAIYFFNSTSARQQPLFTPSVCIISLAAIVELLAEPFHIRALTTLRINARVRAEGAAILAKSMVSLAVMLVGRAPMSLIAFALGQLAYAVTLVAMYWKEAGSEAHETLTLKSSSKGEPVKPLFDPGISKLSFAMTQQSFVKHALTEGDKFMVSRISPLEDQGAYALAANYGSVVARIVFQPIEESARLYFSKTLAPVIHVSTPVPGANVSVPLPPLISSIQTLATLILLQIHLGLFLLTFGPPFLPLLLSRALPKSYLSTSAPTILHVYIYYLPLMALNGTLEAFLASICSPKDLAAQSRWMVIFSVLTVGAGWTFAVAIGMGDVGLVWANVLNSFGRAVYCISVIRAWVKEKMALARGANKAANTAVDTGSATIGGVNKASSKGNSALAGVTGINVGKLTAPVTEPITKPLGDVADAGAEKVREIGRAVVWRDVIPPSPVWIVFATVGVVMRWTPSVISYKPGIGLMKDAEFILVGIVGFVSCVVACLRWEKNLVEKAKYFMKKQKEQKDQ